MAGTRAGGLRAYKTNIERHGSDFFKKIGALGGKASHTGGFTDKALASRAGKIGGKLGKRGKANGR